jgi:hypothetical protein
MNVVGAFVCTYCRDGLDEIWDGEEPFEQYDRYGIYAGRWHESCWEAHGYGDFVFDAAYAGEHLEEDG